MHVQNEPDHVMACVVKRETPPIWRWKLCEFQHGKSISESGINNIGWGGLISINPFSQFFSSKALCWFQNYYIISFMSNNKSNLHSNDVMCKMFINNRTS